MPFLRNDFAIYTLYIYQQHFRFTFSFAKYLSYFHHFSAISMYFIHHLNIFININPSYIHNIFPISSSYPLSIISPKYLLITSPFSPSYLFFIYPLSHKHHLSVISPSLITILYVKSPQRSTISQPYSRHISAVSLSS